MMGWGRRGPGYKKRLREPHSAILRLCWHRGVMAADLIPPLGAWAIHGVCIILLKLLFNCFPGVNQERSWTLVNITYMAASFLMFHWVRGVPFEFNAGAYDNLNMWEQIDNGDQYTPAKKFLLVVPILVFLLSTHFTHYDLTYFIINFLAVLLVVIPKLPFVSLSRVPYMSPKVPRLLTEVPQSHRMRVGFLSGQPED